MKKVFNKIKVRKEFAMKILLFLIASIMMLSTNVLSQATNTAAIRGYIINHDYAVANPDDFVVTIVDKHSNILSTAQIKNEMYEIIIPKTKEDIWLTLPIENCKPIKKKITNKTVNMVLNLNLVNDGRGNYVIDILKDPDWN